MSSKYPQNSYIVDAIYNEDVQGVFRGNPVIEVLDTALSVEDMLNNLKLSIPFDKTERLLPSYIRRECLSGLYQFFQPWGVHLEMYEKFTRAIKSGYINRNPLAPEFTKDLNGISSCVRNRDSNFSTFSATNTGATGFSVIGYSGIGKTSLINRVLANYPQVITHTEYKGIKFPHTQIVWMKLECPFDGSVKGLCTNFFLEFDRITGDNTYYKNAASSRATTDVMIPQMALIAKRHSLGALIIDEIQNISAAKSGGVQKMLNFIMNLINTIGVPVILVGIPEAISVLSSNLMVARRNTGQQGSIVMDFLDRDSDNWNIFINGLWKYQWTSQYTPLTEEMNDIMNESSCGIVDVAVKLYDKVQQLAIINGENGQSEEITSDLLIEAADSTEFILLRDKINNIRKSGGYLSNYNGSLSSWSEAKKKDIKNSLPKRGENKKSIEKLQHDNEFKPVNEEVMSLVAEQLQSKEYSIDKLKDVGVIETMN